MDNGLLTIHSKGYQRKSRALGVIRVHKASFLDTLGKIYANFYAIKGFFRTFVPSKERE
jgi:hypothetical protein